MNRAGMAKDPVVNSLGGQRLGDRRQLRQAFLRIVWLLVHDLLFYLKTTPAGQTAAGRWRHRSVYERYGGLCRHSLTAARCGMVSKYARSTPKINQARERE